MILAQNKAFTNWAFELVGKYFGRYIQRGYDNPNRSFAWLFCWRRFFWRVELCDSPQPFLSEKPCWLCYYIRISTNPLGRLWNCSNYNFWKIHCLKHGDQNILHEIGEKRQIACESKSTLRLFPIKKILTNLRMKPEANTIHKNNHYSHWYKQAQLKISNHATKWQKYIPKDSESTNLSLDSESTTLSASERYKLISEIRRG